MSFAWKLRKNDEKYPKSPKNIEGDAQRLKDYVQILWRCPWSTFPTVPTYKMIVYFYTNRIMLS